MIEHYYNDNDSFVCDWLEVLIRDGQLPPGDVDRRPIQQVDADDLTRYTQCHFFAGIGGWPLALRLAGWPADRPVWTGSCPCQPFSVAGKGGGESDVRHLWPEFRRLIAIGRPATIFGEQVASRLGRNWLAAVRADLEGLGYAVGGGRSVRCGRRRPASAATPLLRGPVRPRRNSNSPTRRRCWTDGNARRPRAGTGTDSA